MREVDVGIVTEKVKTLCMEANFDLGQDVLNAFKGAKAKEESPTAIEILGQLEENASIARQEKVGICQDTGIAIVFVELGQDVHLVGGGILMVPYSKG